MRKQKVTKKWIKMTESILCTTAILSGCFATVSASEIDSVVDYSTMPEYSAYEEIIGDTAATHDGNGSYALYDIDQDGTKELIISFGESNADWVNYIYTLEDGTPQSIGSFYSPVLLYVADDNNGIYSVYGHMGYQKVERIMKQDKQIAIETVMEGDVGDEEYYSNESPIIQSSFPGYEIPSNEQTESSNSYTTTGDLFDRYGGYYTNPDTYRIMKICETNSYYSSYDAVLEVSKCERMSPDAGGVTIYGLEQTSENTAKVIYERKGSVSECGTMTFYDGGVDIYWSSNEINETYVVGMP